MFLLLVNVTFCLLKDKLLENKCKVPSRRRCSFSSCDTGPEVAVVGHLGSCLRSVSALMLSGSRRVLSPRREPAASRACALVLALCPSLLDLSLVLSLSWVPFLFLLNPNSIAHFVFPSPCDSQMLTLFLGTTSQN